MGSEFFILANGRETRHSSATLSRTAESQKGKGASRWRGCIWKSYYSTTFAPAAIASSLVLKNCQVLSTVGVISFWSRMYCARMLRT